MRIEKQIYYNEKFAHHYIENGKLYILPNIKSIIEKLTEWYPQLNWNEEDIDKMVIDKRRVNVFSI